MSECVIEQQLKSIANGISIPELNDMFCNLVQFFDEVQAFITPETKIKYGIEINSRLINLFLAITEKNMSLNLIDEKKSITLFVTEKTLPTHVIAYVTMIYNTTAKDDASSRYLIMRVPSLFKNTMLVSLIIKDDKYEAGIAAAPFSVSKRVGDSIKALIKAPGVTYGW